jgi:Zn-dependent protease
VPLSGLIPKEALPAAAAGSAIVLTGLFALFQSAISSWSGQITTLLKNAAGGFITGRILDHDKEKRTIRLDEMEKLYLGFSRPELLVLLAATLIIGILFLFADRQPFEPVMIAIYIVMGGLGLVIHELAHLYFERRFSCRTEIQFWGIGTLIMALTAWLFGNVFAQPFLTLVHAKEPLEKRTVGHMMLAGPAVSLVLACLCLLLIPMDGLLRTAGMIGFLMNMVTAVFELLPIPPCEGKEIFAWNKLVWAAAFVPLFIIYLFMTM